ncbi:DUF2264 C-terminal domain-containing protein [Aquibacillus rhizosphaerae]|uniref:DUF2264 C-terminal domain-containing protein n=1 Tax=Aquibacillus rhizosphaerae TaxID=3051431 RepID=UPI002F421EB5
MQFHPYFIVCRQETKNHVVAFNTGHKSTNEHTHTSAKYEKFAYSNFFGFSVPRAEWGLAQGAFDSMLALSEGDNLYRVKRSCEETAIENGVLFAEWKPWFDVQVSTWLIPGTPWHIRIHRIETERYLDTAEGGFAIAIEDARYREEQIGRSQNEKKVLVTFSWGSSGIKDFSGTGKPELVFPNSNTNLLHSRTVIPTIKSKINPGTSWLVSAVLGEPDMFNNDSWEAAPRVEVNDNHVVVYSAGQGKIIFKKNIV